MYINQNVIGIILIYSNNNNYNSILSTRQTEIVAVATTGAPPLKIQLRYGIRSATRRGTLQAQHDFPIIVSNLYRIRKPVNSYEEVLVLFTSHGGAVVRFPTI